MPGYIEVGNPVIMTYVKSVPTPVFGMKSLFSNNASVYYKQGSLASGGVDSVRNARHKWKHT